MKLTAFTLTFIFLSLFHSDKTFAVAQDEIQLLCQLDTIYNRDHRTTNLTFKNCTVTDLGSDHFGKIKEERLEKIKLELKASEISPITNLLNSALRSQDYVSVTIATHMFNHLYTGKTKMFKMRSLNLNNRAFSFKGMLVEPSPSSVPCSIAPGAASPLQYFDC